MHRPWQLALYSLATFLFGLMLLGDGKPQGFGLLFAALIAAIAAHDATNEKVFCVQAVVDFDKDTLASLGLRRPGAIVRAWRWLVGGRG